ncbi:methionine--tRNA ligase [Patescibacteria group bacterium]|nr:methionine--tRNA ligase [Patescibacteria group bacterium]
MSEKFYLTTTLPYVNSDPHIGFALELVQADAVARYFKLSGREVFFSTGTDEHGQKIAEKADEAGKSRQDYVDHYAAEFKKLIPTLGILSDIHFIRTTDEAHVRAAQELWRRCEKAGDIYKKKYKGLYCVGDEMFMKESELVDGRCPNHPNLELQEIEEENYFFRLSNYQKYLEGYLSREGIIVPEWRRLEALKFLEQGLEDFSISREVSRMDWGIPVPGDAGHVMYVWFDALTNYISTLGWPEDTDGNYKNFWENGFPVQVAGKDQIRFQSIMWQAMLKSAGLSETKKVVYHGFITSGGQKMSKSLGNVISPFELVERYGTEATRYLLLRHVHPFEDTDITFEKLTEWYNANLANGLGNLAARIMKMAETHLQEPVDIKDDTDALAAYANSFEKFNVGEALDSIWQKIGSLDLFIQTEQPFKVIKTDREKGIKDITYLVSSLYDIAVSLKPFMSETSEKILAAIKENKMPESLFVRKE